MGATYLWIHRDLIHGFSGLSSPVAFIISTGLVLTAFTFKLAFTAEDAPELIAPWASTLLTYLPGSSLVARAQAVFIGLAVATTITLLSPLLTSLISKPPPSLKSTPLSTLLMLYTLLAATQSRTPNIPLFLLFNIITKYLGSIPLSVADLSLTTILLSHLSFFAMGGTNAISSIDLSSAYNGISDFSPVPVGLLTFVSNWAGAIYWTFAVTTLLVRKRKAGGDGGGVWLQYVACLTVFVAASVLGVMAACTVLRTHLFVWTVFSPKYLYAVGWGVGMHLGVNVGLGGVLYWFGSRL